ncbi:MAG TPA: protoglobin domain-containing protein [Rhodocyclaceae bacterium]|nr:protoglobin domain-containing protein [Rhodocyclaceae bacterium]
MALSTQDQTLLQEMDLTDDEIELRKAFLELHADDVAMLRQMDSLARQYADPVIEEFYGHILSFKETADFFRDPATLRRVKQMQKQYFLDLTSGEFGREYTANRVRLGIIHQRINLAIKWYLGMFNFYLRNVAKRLTQAHPDDPAKVLNTLMSLVKIIFYDIGVQVDTYIYQRERTIRQQQEAIRELSTPVLQVRERLLILPIIGIIDTYRARQLTENLLKAIRDNRAKVVVIDITGVAAVDSRVANHLLQTVAAAKLMGATVIITGLSAEVAQTLVTLGVDLSSLNTVGDLQGGIEEAERMLGYKVISTRDAASS